MIRQAFVLCLLVAVVGCMSNTAEAQLFRRLVAPLVQQRPVQVPLQNPIRPQEPLVQQPLLQRPFFQPQQGFVPQRQQAVQRFQSPSLQGPTVQTQTTTTRTETFLVEVDSQGRILRQRPLTQSAPQVRETRVVNFVEQQAPQVRSVRSATISVPQPVVRSQPVYRSQPIVRSQPAFSAPSQVNGFISNVIRQPLVPGFSQQFSSPSFTSPSIQQTFAAPAVTQVDIARQPVFATVASPILAGPTNAVAQAQTAETVALIEPATETPLGTLADNELVPDSNVVPAAASEDVADTTSALDSDAEIGVSILEAPGEEPGSLGTLLNGPGDDN